MSRIYKRWFSTAARVLFVSAISAVSALYAQSAAPVEQYGRLYAGGNKIVGERSGGNAVQLKGPSMQWSVAGWGSDKFFIKETVNALVDGWRAQIIRAPLGIDFSKVDGNGKVTGVSGGYIEKPGENWARVKTVVDAAIAKKVYAIVDWHAHNAHEPAVQAKAIEFFTSPDLAGRYGNDPAVIFEIFNEPEADVTWAEVKAYSNAVIKAIRDAGFKNLILVGSPHWDTETNIAALDPPTDPEGNIAFTFHFYADAHRIGTKPYFSPAGTTYRSVVQGALNAGFPVFVSEWGTNDATEKGASNFVETDKWHAYLDSNKISSCAWGVTASDYNVLDYWTNIGNPLFYDINDLDSWISPGMMTAHGRYIYKWLTGEDTTYSSTKPVLPEFKGEKKLIPLPEDDAMYSYSTTDSTASVSVEDGTAHLTYKLIKGDYEYTPYVGAGFGVDWLYKCEYGVSYTYKGSAHWIRAQQNDVEDYAYHENFIHSDTASNWTEVTVPWGYFRQPSWAVAVPQNKFRVTDLTWHNEAPDGTVGELWLKDVYCLGFNDDIVSVKPNRGTAANKAAASFIRVSDRLLRLRLARAGKVEIFDLRGSKIRTINLTRGDHVVRMKNLPGGMYLVKASGADGWRGTVRMTVRGSL